MTEHQNEESPLSHAALNSFNRSGNSVAFMLTFLSPPLANYLYPYIFAPGILEEGSLTLWLLVIGVNVQRWKEQASAC
jgi:hypothetical protein